MNSMSLTVGRRPFRGQDSIQGSEFRSPTLLRHQVLAPELPVKSAASSKRIAGFH